MDKKLLIILIIVIFFLLIFFSGITGFPQENIEVSKKLWITCPKNLAVFHILVLISPSGEKMKNRYFHPLTEQAREYFKDFKNHPAVQRTDRIFRMMWYFVLNNIAFYYSEFPEAKLIKEFPPEYKERKAMEKMISEYVELVKDFYVVSKFEDFWNDHTKDIQAMIEKIKENLPQVDIPQLIEDFYGKRVDRFYYVASPFMATSATHVEIQGEKGGWSLYHIDGFQNYSDSFSNAFYAFHEFSHSFIEPISSKYSEEISKLGYLYKPLKERFQRMGYKNWDRAFAEHMVTSGQLHLTRKAFGEKVAEKMLKREAGRGFKLIKLFYDYFKEYDENREKYKELELFYPEILNRLSRLQVEEYRKPGPMGFYPEYKEAQVFIKDIVPDSAFDKAGILKGDILFSVGDDKVTSEESFYKAKEKWWNAAKEGDSTEIVFVREGEKIKKIIPVPFVTDYKYVEKE